MQARRIVTLAGLAAGSMLAVAAPGSANSSAFTSCESLQLRLAASFYGEAGGQFIQTFTFTNVSRRVCRMEGWPSLEIEVASHRPVPVRTRRVVQGPLRARPFARVLLRARGASDRGSRHSLRGTRSAARRRQDPELSRRVLHRSGDRGSNRSSIVVFRLASLDVPHMTAEPVSSDPTVRLQRVFPVPELGTFAQTFARLS